jgi:hypothetical protein
MERKFIDPKTLQFDCTCADSMQFLHSLIDVFSSGRPVPVDDLQRLRGEIEKLLRFHAQSRKRFVQQITDFEKFVRQIPEASTHCTQLKLDSPPVPPPIGRRGEGKLAAHVTHAESLQKSAQQSQNLNVWHRCENFFQHLPTQEEIDEMFAVVQRIPPPLNPKDINPEHWGIAMGEVARRSSDKLRQPPGPAPSLSDIGDFWKATTTRFPIEQIQRQNFSPLHALLNSFVELDDVEKGKRSDRGLFLQRHSLLPEVQCDPYLALGFDVRLQLEFASLQLDRPAVKSAPAGVLLQDEIKDDLKVLTDELLPDLQDLQKSITEKIGIFREAEAERIRKARESEKLLQSYRARLQKK